MALHTDELTVLVETSGEADDDGIVAVTTARKRLEGVNVQPVGTEESLGAAQPITSRWRVSTLEPEDWIESGDRIEWRGSDRYEVLGRPQTFWNVRPHTEFMMTETKG